MPTILIAKGKEPVVTDPGAVDHPDGNRAREADGTGIVNGVKPAAAAVVEPVRAQTPPAPRARKAAPAAPAPTPAPVAPEAPAEAAIAQAGTGAAPEQEAAAQQPAQEKGADQ